MTHPTLQDLLAPPLAAGGMRAHWSMEAIAETLLERFRQEEQTAVLAAGPDAGANEILSAEAEEALYAWGVMCYGQGRHADASALFGAARRRRPPTSRLSMALGAARLAQHDAAGASEAFAQVHRLNPEDAEVLFYWAEAECLRSRLTEARALLQEAVRLVQAHPAKWPNLMAWCDKLRLQAEGPTSV